MRSQVSCAASQDGQYTKLIRALMAATGSRDGTRYLNNGFPANRKARVAVIKDRRKTPTAVEPAGDTMWVAERGVGKTVSIPMPK